MRENFIFYRSFYESLSQLGDKARLELYDAIMELSFFDSEIGTETEQNQNEIETKLFQLCTKIETKLKQKRNVFAQFLLIKPVLLKSAKGYISKTSSNFKNLKKHSNLAYYKEKDKDKDIKEEVEEEKKEEEIVEIKKQKELGDFYGEYKNVHLTKHQYDVLYTCILNEVILKELIEELSEAIVRGKNNCKPYDEKNPNKHFADLKAFWRFRREHPEKYLHKDTDSGGSEKSQIRQQLEEYFANKKECKT